MNIQIFHAASIYLDYKEPIQNNKNLVKDFTIYQGDKTYHSNG